MRVLSDRRILIAICVGIGVVVGAAIASAVLLTVRRPRQVIVEVSSLAPDRSAVTYRHPVRATAPTDEAAAVAELERRMKDKPSPYDAGELAELYLKRAQRDGDPKDYAASEAMARRSLELMPHPNSARLTLARIAAANHHFRRAIELVKEQFEEKHVGGGYIILATAHLALGELREAIEAADVVVEKRPDTEAYLTRALVLEAQGRDAEAGHDFTRAAALEVFGNPDDAARLRALWARFLLRRGEPAGARLVLEEAQRLSPRQPLVTAMRAELALRTGDAAGAKKLFEDAFA
ncbi:MAG: hypothetical protein KIT31_15025, partial [Deltaproteobacteria bacterium]|nr:hypothetical protein [Deltaproteobacteria bacterium]